MCDRSDPRFKIQDDMNNETVRLFHILTKKITNLIDENKKLNERLTALEDGVGYDKCRRDAVSYVNHEALQKCHDPGFNYNSLLDESLSALPPAKVRFNYDTLRFSSISSAPKIKNVSPPHPMHRPIKYPPVGVEVQ